MLPHTLSSGICSLAEGEQIGKVYPVRFSPNFVLLGHHIYESVICSDRRLTSRPCSFCKKIAGRDSPSFTVTSRYSEIGTTSVSFNYKNCSRKLYQVASELRRKEWIMVLELASSEVKIFIDEMGQPENLPKCGR